MTDAPDPADRTPGEDGDDESPEVVEAITFAPDQPWPWPAGERLIAQDGFGWHVDEDMGNMLLLVWGGITDQMVEEFYRPCDVALLASGPLVGLLVRFGGGWDWSETMAWRTTEPAVPSHLRAPGPGDHLTFHAVLVDQRTRIVRGTKFFTVSPHFTKALCREVADRWDPPTTNEVALAAREEWMRKHPTIPSALKASLARSHGGD